jgi:hypothetical protein
MLAYIGYVKMPGFFFRVNEHSHDVPTCSNVFQRMFQRSWQERVEVLHALSRSHFSSVATQLRVMWTYVDPTGPPDHSIVCQIVRLVRAMTRNNTY